MEKCLHRRAQHAVAVLFVLFSLVGALQRIPSTDLLSDEAHFRENYGKHVYFAERASRLLCDQGALWGWDPTIGAGILIHSGWFISYLFPAIAGCAFSLPGAITIKWMLFLFFALSPSFSVIGARLLGLDRRQALWAGILDFLLIHLTGIGYSVMVSMVSSHLAYSLNLLLAGTLVSMNRIRLRTISTMFTISLFGVFAGVLNPHSLFPLAVTVSGVAIWKRSVFAKPQAFAALIVPAVIVIAVLRPWSQPGIAFMESVENRIDMVRFVRFAWKDFYGYWVFMTALQPIYLFLAASSLYTIFRPHNRHQDSAIFGFSVYLFTLLSVAATTAVGKGLLLFPMRFIDASILFLLPAGGVVMDEIGRSRRGNRLIQPILIALLAFLQIRVSVGVPLTFSAPPQAVYELTDALQENTDRSARILVESSHNPDALTFRTDVAPYLAYWLPDRELMAIPTTESPELLVNSILFEGILSWVPIKAYSADEIFDYLVTYNVGWVLVFHPDSIDAFSRMGDRVKRIESLGEYVLFRVRREGNAFLTGSGSVDARLGQLILSDLKSDANGDVVISYRAFGSLKTLDGTPIEVFQTGLEPIGLIKLHHPPETVTIVNDRSFGYPDSRANIERKFETVVKRLSEMGVDVSVDYGEGIIYK
ncbi:MAG: hypothetical protein IT350_18075 [Deltaproteobacteria bacterium]|nr:hypothetical protein [Deltaproteobacteria bacterium]